MPFVQLSFGPMKYNKNVIDYAHRRTRKNGDYFHSSVLVCLQGFGLFTRYIISFLFAVSCKNVGIINGVFFSLTIHVPLALKLPT